MRALVEQLTSGVERLGSEGRWQQFLAAQARFHRYSYSNTLLILGQLPEEQRAIILLIGLAIAQQNSQ